MKYSLCFCLSILCVAAYAQKQDTVRWFVGHWVDKKTFRIDSTLSGKKGGGTITATPGSGLRFTSPAQKAFDDNLNEGIHNIAKAEQEIATTSKQTEGLYQFGLTNETLKELEKVRADLNAFSKVEEKSQPPAKSANALQLEKTCAALSPEYHRIIDFYKAHKGEKNPHFDLPAPPVADYFNCWGADSAKRIEFDTLSGRYVRDFFREESAAVNFLLGNLQLMDAYGIGGVYVEDVDQDLKQAFDSTKSHHGPCSYVSYIDMSRALEFYFERGMQMVKQLWRDNVYNYGAYKPVVTLCLTAYQLQCAFGNITLDELTGEMTNMAKPLERLYDTLTYLLFEKRDYKLIGTIPFMVGVYQGILGFATRGTVNGEIQYNDDYRPKYPVKTLMGFPRFELTIELEAKVGEKGNYAIAHLKSKSNVIAELSDKEGVHFSLSKAENEKIKAGILDNESISPGPHAIYVGTKLYSSQSPIFKIKLCEMKDTPAGDSIYLSTFKPMLPGNGDWILQGKTVSLGINNLDRLFINTEQVVSDVAGIDPKQHQQQLEEIKKNALEMAAKIQAMQASNMDPLKMAEMVKGMMNNNSGLVENKASELMRIRLPLTINNGEKVLVNQRFDAKRINSSFSQPIVYAYLTVKLEHKGGEAGTD